MQNDLISRNALKKDLLDRSFFPAIVKNALENAPAVDAVSRPVFEQTQWERDCAMQQLKEHGIPFGGIAPAVDAVALETLEGKMLKAVMQKQDGTVVEFLPVVRCKDCKHYMKIHCICDGCCISDYWYCAGGELREDDG